MTTTHAGAGAAAAIAPIPALDLYRDIHKGLRSALFTVTAQAGSTDPSDPAARAALAEQVRHVAWLLDHHAENEDERCQALIETYAPDLAAEIARTHPVLEARVAALVALAGRVAATDGADARAATQALYLELASFTGEYLAHQDFEERQVMRALDAASSFEELLATQQAIIASIPPDEMVAALRWMLPAMNVDDRTELLGGMQAGAPPEAFAGVCALAADVLDAEAWAATAQRLGIAPA